ncbi:acyltransferase domain-containing protein [Actinophytocola sp.]|uniref:acyltransferase domain-containing protein n=1 Tax=Actinophytocola sp. TaxID=1872138 RepID=UPI00389A1F0E
MTATPRLIALSAPDPAGLADLATQVGALAADQPRLALARLASSLAARPAHPCRMALVATSVADVATSLLGGDDRAQIRGTARRDPPLVFLYPGVGEHYPAMAAELYGWSPVFRAALDECCELAEAELGENPRAQLDLTGEQAASGAAPGWPDLAGMMRPAGRPPVFDEPRTAQVLVFAVEYALAESLRHWGLVPSAMLGYSIGEYTAACVAGVLELADAVRLVARRALLIEETEPGGMLAVLLSAEDVRTRLARVGDPRLAVAIVDGPALCVVSGPADAVAELAEILDVEGIASRRLPVRHAFHSPVLAPAEAPLARLVAGSTLRAPEIPVVSNVTGTWLTARQATDAGYWAAHMLRTVQFFDGLGEVWALPEPVLLEVGPGRTLGTLAGQHPARAARSPVLSTMPGQGHGGSGIARLLAAVGGAWVHGLPVDLGRVTG